MNHHEHYDDVMCGIGDLGKVIPGTIGGFFTMHKEALADGALSKCEKELMALAIGIAVRCGGCITCHVKDALAAGATPEQVYETIGVAILMGGGPAAVYGNEARKALESFVAAPV
ncbi:carboxymuconolactone decarboxylase family protein [Demequina sp. SYSU T00192]|uniref:Carboxymuconolactone decarboxylase family protein n=1 Tax=Demequina litoralis TaxID=3051660 RepID=A0ABT8G6K8_9MICO|nr:carboxymuconolactone decarboxylase family protein [Demequina sp. SYSU T00192]MDN4474767.1 carboxymuconolactone decarboxylase family protein [Demequina sp. SYSU T00192]